MQKEIEAQTRITQLFGQQASKAVGDYAASQLKAANELRLQGREEEAKAIEALWGETGTARLAAHTVIGGLTGGASGAAGSLAGTLTAPLVAEELAKAGITGNLATTLTAIASTTVGGAVGGATGAGTALNEVANNYLTHEEIQKGNAAMKNCAARGGDVTACQKKVVSALQELDIARDKELLEAQRIAEFAEYQIHWGCKSDTACIDQYRGVQVKAENMLNTVRLLDRNGAITFDGYHPSIKIDSLLALDGAVNQSQQTYKKVSEYLAENGIGGALSDAANGLANVIPATVAGAKDFITAPIPAHILAQTLDNMTLLTAQNSGALAFDVTSGMALSYVSGKVMGWTLEKGWQALSGTAAEMAEAYLKKQGLMPAVVPEGPKVADGATSAAATSDQGVKVSIDGHKIYDPRYPAIGTNPDVTYRFSDPTYRSTGGDVYFGENLATAYFEVRQNVSGKSLFVGQVEVKNMLDLTDPTVLKNMSIDSSKLYAVASDTNNLAKNAVYTYTNEIANQAYDAGYTGIIYSSTRNPGGKAVVLFDGRYDPKTIQPVIDYPLSNGTRP